MPYRNAITICLYTHERGPIRICHVTPCRPIRTVHLWGTLDYFARKFTLYGALATTYTRPIFGRNNRKCPTLPYEKAGILWRHTLIGRETKIYQGPMILVGFWHILKRFIASTCFLWLDICDEKLEINLNILHKKMTSLLNEFLGGI